MAEPNYAWEAVKLKPNLVFLASGVVMAVVLSSVPMLGAVAGLEVMFISAVASNPRFRRAIRARSR